MRRLLCRVFGHRWRLVPQCALRYCEPCPFYQRALSSVPMGIAVFVTLYNPVACPGVERCSTCGDEREAS